VDDYLSETEQWERVKAWLRANGLWIVAGIAVGALGIGGWRWWQAHTDQLALDAGSRYEQVLKAFSAGDQARGLALIDGLERDHAGSPYVDQANLAAARVFVESNELERAAQRLKEVVDQSRDPELVTIAKLRLARVQTSLGKPDEALATLGSPLTGAFASRYHEIRGDAYYAKGDKARALDEYRAARVAAGPSVAGNDVLNLKINDLTGANGTQGGSPATAPTAASGTGGAAAVAASGTPTRAAPPQARSGSQPSPSQPSAARSSNPAAK
jgi:predicted negative regulator of RcsB-dependent stress response